MRWMLLGLMGCGDPLLNEPPFLVRYNGLRVDQLWRPDLDLTPITAVPGEAFVIELEIGDLEGDTVQLWFPRAPPGWDFEPESRSGVWQVPDDPYLPNGFEILLEESERPFPRNEIDWLPLYYDLTE